jgi:hypothetical protein
MAGERLDVVDLTRGPVIPFASTVVGLSRPST